MSIAVKHTPGPRVEKVKKAGAVTLLRRIDRNIDDFYSERISYETFSACQREIWIEIQSRRSVETAVLRMLRSR